MLFYLHDYAVWLVMFIPASSRSHIVWSYDLTIFYIASIILHQIICADTCGVLFHEFVLSHWGILML